MNIEITEITSRLCTVSCILQKSVITKPKKRPTRRFENTSSAASKILNKAVVHPDGLAHIPMKIISPNGLDSTSIYFSISVT